MNQTLFFSTFQVELFILNKNYIKIADFTVLDKKENPLKKLNFFFFFFFLPHKFEKNFNGLNMHRKWLFPLIIINVSLVEWSHFFFFFSLDLIS